ncbi:MAG: DNA polymerase III subunit gamma/tau [Rhodospirillales bacterium]
MTETAPPDTAAAELGAPYQVLARKYRPATFAGLIGQEAMVRTLTNAIRADRLAQAFILTGVRGVGKTSTARIIARALNCVGADGKGGPTPEPCGVCAHCQAISEDRHVDVIEMDAASRSKVEEMRELLDGVHYRPTSARFKVYIVDEVHMLSKHAFNALLKTLEEPPEHVKFVFATTEIRKVPVTVLSRCQRFDLRRINAEALAQHFRAIADNEGAKVSDAALALIARVADGSVRDGLSLLDQAISHATHGAGGEIGEADVRDMLGLADRSQSFMLLEAVLAGDIAQALKLLDQFYRDGADPLAVLEDLLDITHWLTRIKVVPAAAEAPEVPETERVRGRDLEGRLSMASLARAWQMLLKGLAEARQAPSPIQAVEMVLVRLAHAAELPTPEEAIRRLEGADSATGSPAPTQTKDTAGPDPAPPRQSRMTGTGDASAPRPRPEADAETRPAPEASQRPDPATLEAVADLAREKGEAGLHAFLVDDVHLVRFEPGRIEFSTRAGAPGDMVQKLREFLNGTTARIWTLTVSRDAGQRSLAERRDAAGAQGGDTTAGAAEATGVGGAEDAARHPLVKAVLDTFPGATIEDVRDAAGPEPASGNRDGDGPEKDPD